MKLTEIIESRPENTIFHIGSQSNFFFVGNREEYENNIDTISDKYRSYIERELETFETSIRIARGKLLKARHEYERQALQEQITGYMTRYEALQNAYKITSKAPSMRDREVLDVCLNTVDGGINIKVEGWEQGRYWKLSEWRAKHEI